MGSNNQFANIKYEDIMQAVPYPALPKRDKPRRVDKYFSSWVIKPGKYYLTCYDY